MTSESKFNFSLLRISIAQLLKAHGFDKCNNRVLDTVTDLYVRHFQLLLKTTQKYKEIREIDSVEDDPVIQDIADAFVELGVIFPAVKLDTYDINPIANKGIESFEDWFQSEKTTRAREIARPSFELVKERMKISQEKNTQSKKMENFTAAIGQSTRSKNNNHLISTGNPLALTEGEIDANDTKADDNELNTQDEIDDESVHVDEDWIKYQLRQQLDEDNIKLKGTVLLEYIPYDKKQPKLKKPDRDFLIMEDTPDRLRSFLPYSSKSDDDDESSEEEEDDHEDEIVPMETNDEVGLEEEEISDKEYQDGEATGYESYENNFGGNVHMVDEDGFDYYDHNKGATGSNASNDLNLFGW